MAAPTVASIAAPDRPGCGRRPDWRDPDVFQSRGPDRSNHHGQLHPPRRRPDLSRLRWRLDRPVQRQRDHSQRHRRPFLHINLGRVDMGVFRVAVQKKHHRIQSPAPYRPRRAQRYGGRLYPGDFPGDERQPQPDPRCRFLQFLGRGGLGTVQRRRLDGHPPGEQRGLQHDHGQLSPALRP